MHSGRSPCLNCWWYSQVQTHCLPPPENRPPDLCWGGEGTVGLHLLLSWLAPYPPPRSGPHQVHLPRPQNHPTLAWGSSGRLWHGGWLADILGDPCLPSLAQNLPNLVVCTSCRNIPNACTSTPRKIPSRTPTTSLVCLSPAHGLWARGTQVLQVQSRVRQRSRAGPCLGRWPRSTGSAGISPLGRCAAGLAAG